MEALIFFYVCVAFFAALAVLAYGAIVSLIWSVRLQGGGLGRALSPPGSNLKDYLGECLLVLSTAALLTLALAAKHAFVGQILQFQITDPNRLEVSQLFPLHAPPDEVEQEGEDILFLRNEEGALALSAALPASAFIKPILESGRSESARILALDVIGRVDPEGARRLRLKRTLQISIALIAVAYLAWISYRRARQTSDQSSETVPGLGKTLCRLTMLAVSTALVLISPSLLDDAGLADAALASLRRQPQGPRNQERYVSTLRTAVQRQQELYSDLRLLRPDSDVSVESVWTLFSDIENQTRSLERSMTRGDNELEESLSRFNDRRDEDLQKLDERFGSVGNEMGEVRELIGTVQSGEELLKKTLASYARELALLFDQAEQGTLDVKQHEQDIQDLFARLDEAEKAADRNRTGLDDMESHLSQSQSELETRLEAIGNLVGGTATGFLILNSSRPTTFEVRGVGDRQSVPGPTVLELAPGTYQVSAMRSQPRSIVVEGGKIRAVWFSPPDLMY